jgi:hypothetical protein
MRPRVCLFASAVLILLINAAPLPADTAASVNLASVDVCSLLTQAELSTAFGVPMGSVVFHRAATVPGTVPGTKQCAWRRSPSTEGDPRQRPILLEELDLCVMPFVETNFLAENDRVGDESVTSISGLGDDAYYMTVAWVTGLDVKKGAIIVRVTLIGGATDRQTVMDAERTIAAQVLSEL